MSSTFAPGLVIDGMTIYPSGPMYLLAFALAGFKWAQEQIEQAGYTPEFLAYQHEMQDYPNVPEIFFCTKGPVT